MKRIPRGVPCLIVLAVFFGYMAYVMGLTNMLNTIMRTAHDLLLNTVFYLMGMCVITGALGKILVEFGVVDLLQRLLRPVMKPLFNMPGVASLGAVLTFLSDNPAIIALSQDRGFAQYFKRYQHVSLVNFGTAFGMGLLVIVFMVGQGYFVAPFVGFFGAMCGCIISTRLMQYFTLKDCPEYREQDAVVATPAAEAEGAPETEAGASAVGEAGAEVDAAGAEVVAPGAKRTDQSTFVHVLNALLDGGKDGVNIGLAIIPGVLIISTLVMMLTFGGTVEGTDAAGNDIVVYTGGAYQGTQLLPWLAGKISFVFEWLFGFTAPELVAFPITALGAVGAALSLIPEFTAKGIIDGNAIAVFTAMGMCWSGYLSTDAATLDSLGYRHLVPRAFLATFLGGIGAGIIAHWAFVAITAISGLFAPNELWTAETAAYDCFADGKEHHVELVATDDGVYTAREWFGTKGYDLCFTVNAADSSVNVTNAYAEKDGAYFFVAINKDAHRNEPAYAALYTPEQYSEFDGDAAHGHFYVYTFIYDNDQRIINRGYYELTWGDRERQTVEAEKLIDREKALERQAALIKADSIRRAQIADSLLQEQLIGAPKE